jgi:hypothetical protein
MSSEGRLVVNGELNQSVAVSAAVARLAGTGQMGKGTFFGSVEPGGTAFPDYGAMGFSGAGYLRCRLDLHAPEIRAGSRATGSTSAAR